MVTTTAVAKRTRPAPPSGVGRLALGAIGVVFGDIGTSVLYAFQQIFAGPHDVGVQESRALGAVSMIFWTLTLVVTVKYVLIVMRASNDGEGGIMALTALLHRLHGLPGRTLAVLSGLGVLGAALFYGDGMITPAVSVLSAVEGLSLASKAMGNYEIPIAVIILVLLFAAQKFGTHRVGAAFGPVMVLWFVVISVLGLASIVQTPTVLAGLSPTYAIEMAIQEPLVAFLSLGSVVLCVTGAEALYADMGHFTAGPIRLSWFSLVWPALILNYFGQAALVLRSPESARDPFYLLVPQSLMWPMVILATLATVIASQAVISGAFSMTEQAIRLHYLPRMTIKHTSASQRGQIYVPLVNWALCIAVVALVLGFRDSSNLASAYGIAVTGTFVITTILITNVARKMWRVPLWALIPVSGFFLFIDLSFFGANLMKITSGGWFPLVIAVVLFTVFMTWSRGLALLRAKLRRTTMNFDQLQQWIEQHHTPVIPGTAIFVSGNTNVPVALTEYVRRGGALRETMIHLATIVEPVPTVPTEEQLTITPVMPHLTRIEIRYGFMQTPSGKSALQAAVRSGLEIDPHRTIVVFHSARVVPTSEAGMAMWRKRVFAFLMRNGSPPAAVLSIDPDQVMEWTSLVRI